VICDTWQEVSERCGIGVLPCEAVISGYNTLPMNNTYDFICACFT